MNHRKIKLAGNSLLLVSSDISSLNGYLDHIQRSKKDNNPLHKKTNVSRIFLLKRFKNNSQSPM